MIRYFQLLLFLFVSATVSSFGQTTRVIYVCPDLASSRFADNELKAPTSDWYCRVDTKLRVTVVSQSTDVLASQPTVKLLDGGPHRAEVIVNWKPHVAGTVILMVEYQKKIYNGGGECDWRDWTPFIFYEIHHEYENPGKKIDEATTKYAPPQTEVAFNLKYTPTFQLRSELIATHLVYTTGRLASNGEPEWTTADITTNENGYNPTSITYYASDLGIHNLQIRVYTEFENCGKYHDLQSTPLNVISSCVLIDPDVASIIIDGNQVNNYSDGSKGVELNQPYTLDTEGFDDFEGNFEWVLDDFGSGNAITSEQDGTFTVLKEGSYSITARALEEGCPNLNALNVLAGVQNMVIQQPCTITLPDDIDQFYPGIDPHDVILQHIAANVESDRSIILNPGITLELGAELFLDDSGTEPLTDPDKNFIETVTYDERRRIVGQSRAYFDDKGTSTQGQSKNLTSNVVLANETLYDAHGRPAISTLSAPVHGQSESDCPDEQAAAKTSFLYKSNFVTDANNHPYRYQSFDLTKENVPDPVGSSIEGTLGWYYSANNSVSNNSELSESFVPQTSYPYSRTLYKHDGTGNVKGTTSPGDTFKAGSSYLAISDFEPVTASDVFLTEYLNMRLHNFFLNPPVPVEGQFLKTTTIDEMGKRGVTYADKSGKTIIGLYYGNQTTPLTKSYQFYDIAGRLLASVTPNGINQYTVNLANPSENNFDAIDKTRYFYNAKGLLSATEEKLAKTSTENPNGISRSEFIYRTDGKIRFSQSAEQRKHSNGRFSYTNYDKSGRTVESGEFISSAGLEFNSSEMRSTSLLDNVSPGGGLTAGTKTELILTSYDEPDLSLSGRTQRFVHGVVSKVQKINPATSQNIITSWYSYDELGRVEWMIQDIQGFGVKTIDYAYGATGAVQDVTYQKGIEAEQFTHHYEYDADGRMSKAYTSRESLEYDRDGKLVNGSTLELQATYLYYLHGPLKRVELADKLQGIDYVYTIDGKLKGINHADPSKDPGNDGLSGSDFTKDAFGMTLDYFTNDYAGTYEYPSIGTTAAPVEDQYSGLIKAQRWHSPVEPLKQVAYAYQYDQRNQLSEAKWGSMTGSNYVPNLLQAYQEKIGGYDLNGNINSLQRKSSKNLLASDNENITTADFVYHYEPLTNKLTSITQGNETFRTYQYDDLGQMVSETETSKTRNVSYDVSGKVVGVYSNEDPPEPIVTFSYDQSGFRLSKTSYNQDGDEKLRTWYVRDGSGNVVATYAEDLHASLPAKPIEFPVYGSGRIGLYKPDYGLTFYEVADHLGNVRAVITPKTDLDAEYLATMETEQTSIEVEEFGFKMSSVTPVGTFANHTLEEVTVDNKNYVIENPNEAVLLNNRLPGQTGPNPIGTGIMLWVHPGDIINAEVYAKYVAFSDPLNTNLITSISTFLATTFQNAPIVDGLPIFNVTNDAGFGMLSAWDDFVPTQPGAFLNYLLFDNNNKLVGYDFVQVTDAAKFTPGIEHPHELLKFDPIEITKEGFIYIYVSNQTDQNIDVYFDDLRVHHSYSDIVAGGDFYPFGLGITDRQINRDEYRYGYQGGFSEHDKETEWNHFELREYDPLIGRWIVPDPDMQYPSPYVAMGNNPVNRLDPDGGTDGPGDDILYKDFSAEFALANVFMGMRRKCSTCGPGAWASAGEAGVGFLSNTWSGFKGLFTGDSYPAVWEGIKFPFRYLFTDYGSDFDMKMFEYSASAAAGEISKSQLAYDLTYNGLTAASMFVGPETLPAVLRGGAGLAGYTGSYLWSGLNRAAYSSKYIGIGSKLFGIGRNGFQKGILNSGTIRAGWGFMAKGKKHVLRIGIGNNARFHGKTKVMGKAIHWHWNIFKVPAKF